MSRFLLVIRTDADREQAVRWSRNVPLGTRTEWKAPRRSLDQNSKMWAMLGEVAKQLKWHGLKLQPESWKLIFLDALKREVRIVPNIDGTGFVNLGRSSSDLTKAEMSDMIELIHMFGATHGVVFADDVPALAPAEMEPA